MYIIYIEQLSNYLGMTGGMPGLSGNIASSLAAMYHQVQAQQHQSPVKILPKISISEEVKDLQTL